MSLEQIWNFVSLALALIWTVFLVVIKIRPLYLPLPLKRWSWRRVINLFCWCAMTVLLLLCPIAKIFGAEALDCLSFGASLLCLAAVPCGTPIINNNRFLWITRQTLLLLFATALIYRGITMT